MEPMTGEEAQARTHRPSDRHLRLPADDVPNPAVHVLRPRVVGLVNCPAEPLRQARQLSSDRSASTSTTKCRAWRSDARTSG